MKTSSQIKNDLPEILRKTLDLAIVWQNLANQLRTKEEFTQQQMMSEILPNYGKVQCFA
jgi:hypothetical protein